MLEDIRKELFILINEIDSICKKYNITYYAEGGTIIGALRHNGFIPWDDDMDIVMTRADFEKFLDAFKKENLKDRILECPETNDKTPLVTIKYINTNTSSIFKSLFLDDFAGGIFIDIFILDPIPRGKERWFKREFLSYTEILNPIYVVNEGESRPFRYSVDLLKCKLFGRDKVLNSYRKKLFCYNDEDCDEYLIRWGITYQTVKKEYYGKPRYYDFDNKIKMPVPHQAERILANYFGEDWFMIPEAEEQYSHNLVRDLKRPYRVYKDDYLRFVDTEKVMKKFAYSKKIKMKTLKTMRKFRRNEIQLKFAHSNLLVQKINQNEVIKAYEEKDYLKVKELTNDYINLQNKGIYRRNHMLFDVDKNFINAVLNTYIIVGEYYKSATLLKTIKHKYDFSEVEKMLNEILFIKQLYYEQKYDEALKKVDKLLENDSNNLSLYKIKMDIITKQQIAEEEIDSCIKTLKNMFKKSNDYELYKYLGDFYMMKSDKVKAESYYETFKNNSRNGMLLLDIK